MDGIKEDKATMEDNIENKRKQLQFRAWHRGTREMDLLMGSFADENVSDFDAVALTQFEDMLADNDPDLYGWYIGQENVPKEKQNPVMAAFLKHTFVAKRS